MPTFRNKQLLLRLFSEYYINVRKKLDYVFSSTDRLVPIVLLSLSLFFFTLFVLDYVSVDSSGKKGKIVGRIFYKKNLVQRKGNQEFTWSNLLSNSTVHQRDIVRADKLSDAEVHLLDGSRIKIEEDSMFRIDFAGNQAQLHFERGAIRIEQSGNSSKSLVVNVDGQNLELSNSNVKIKTGGIGSALLVEKGNARITDAKGKVQLVNPNQYAQFTGGKTSISKIPILLQSPHDRQRLLSEGESRKINFRWNIRVPLKNMRLEFSYSRSFKHLIKNKSVRIKKSAQKNYQQTFKKGGYYWRVIGQTLGKKVRWVSSSFYYFSINKKQKLFAFNPSSNQTIRYVKKRPSVYFSWSPLEATYKYRLKVASSPDLRKKLRKIDLSKSDYVLELPDGLYYWQVGVLKQTDRSQKRLKSALQSFSIRKVDRFISPTLEQPRSRHKVKQADIRKHGLLFSWKAMQELTKFDFVLADNRKFRRPLIRKRLSSNYLRIKRKIPIGIYYWRVRGWAKKQLSSYTPTSQLRIYDKNLNEELKPTKINEAKPIPETGWVVPGFNIPPNVHTYSLAKYRSLLNRTITYRCQKGGVPDVLIRKCFPSYIILNKQGRWRLDMLYFLKMNSENWQEINEAYTYFSENCYFKPARELLEEQKASGSISFLKRKEIILKTWQAFQICQEKNKKPLKP